ncbi:MAG: hypothetical protein ACRYFX_08175 [Janthinobacterium lividum]
MDQYINYDFSGFKNTLIVLRSRSLSNDRILLYNTHSSCYSPTVIQASSPSSIIIVKQSKCSASNDNLKIISTFLKMNVKSIEVDSYENVYVCNIGEDSVNIIKCKSPEHCKEHIEGFVRIDKLWYSRDTKK